MIIILSYFRFIGAAAVGLLSMAKARAGTAAEVKAARRCEVRVIADRPVSPLPKEVAWGGAPRGSLSSLGSSKKLLRGKRMVRCDQEPPAS